MHPTIDLNNKPQKCKILLLGESAVGKTTLFKQFAGDPKERVTPTIGVQYKQKIINMQNGNIITVQLWDTAGTQRYRTITPIYYRNVDGVLLVFDVTDQHSFISVDYWADQLSEKGQDGAQIMLVGNKNDQEQRREVSRQQAEEKAKKMGFTYKQTSSFSHQATEELFIALISQIIDKRSRQPQSPLLQVDQGMRLRQLPKRNSSKEEDCC